MRKRPVISCFTCIAVAVTFCLGTVAHATGGAVWSSGQTGGTSDWVDAGSWPGGSWLGIGGPHGAPGTEYEVVIQPLGFSGLSSDPNLLWPVVDAADVATAGQLFVNAGNLGSYGVPTSTSLTVKGALNVTGNVLINLAGSSVAVFEIANVQSTLTIDGGTFSGNDLNVHPGIFDLNVINGGSFDLSGSFRPINSGFFGSRGQMIIDATSSASVDRWRLFPGSGYQYKLDILGDANGIGSGSLLITNDDQAATWNSGWVQDLLINGDITSNGNIGLAGFKLTPGTDGDGSPNVLIEAVPEPASLALMALGLLGVVCPQRFFPQRYRRLK